MVKEGCAFIRHHVRHHVVITNGIVRLIPDDVRMGTPIFLLFKSGNILLNKRLIKGVLLHWLRVKGLNLILELLFLLKINCLLLLFLLYLKILTGIRLLNFLSIYRINRVLSVTFLLFLRIKGFRKKLVLQLLYLF